MLVGVGKLCGELLLDALPLTLTIRSQALPLAGGDAVRLGASLSQGLLVGGQGLLGLALQTLGGVQIPLNAFPALLDHLADPRQGDA
ncbi:MAG: hypothetical protein R3D31_07250 [Hyphomicrobiaceae bacterium]